MGEGFSEMTRGMSQRTIEGFVEHVSDPRMI